MSAEQIITVSAVVVTLVQLSKWARLPDAWGPLAVLGFSLVGVGVSVFGGDQWPPERTDTWPIFAGWIAVATSAAGVFGFTRAAASAVASASPVLLPEALADRVAALAPRDQRLVVGDVAARASESDAMDAVPLVASAVSSLSNDDRGRLVALLERQRVAAANAGVAIGSTGLVVGGPERMGEGR